MSSSERRKIMCSVMFHVIAITCVVWSLYVLIERTADELRSRKFYILFSLSSHGSVQTYGDPVYTDLHDI